MLQEMYIDCRISGYPDDAVRMIAVVDSQNDQVIISKTLSYQPPKDPYKGKTPEQIAKLKQIARHTVTVIDNSLSFDKWDLHFQENEHLQDAIKAYYSLERSKCLVLAEEIKQHYNPQNIIEIRKTDARGNVHELNSEELNNGYMCVLIIAWTAIRMRNNASLISSDVTPTKQDIDNFSVPFSI